MKDLQLYINNEVVDAGDNGLGIFLNYTLFNPEKLTASTDTEYSFTFKLPTSDKNNRIFGNANVLSVENKYNKIYKAQLNSDGQVLFDGQVLLKSIDNKNYNCNLIVKKGYNLSDLFGEDTLDKLNWFIPFDGAATINQINASATNPDVIFPLVSYGVFQKTPYLSDEVANEYTSKFAIDQYNKFWVESFYPSTSFVSTLKKCFEHVGYHVGGNIFTDSWLSNIYMSTNLADEQIPLYNLANPRFGKVALTSSFSSASYSGTPYEQELNFPYDRIPIADDYKFTSVDLYDILADGNVTISGSPTYMFDRGDKLIVVPADGFYKIDMSVDVTLNSTGDITVLQKAVTGHGTSGEDRAQTGMTEYTLPVGLAEWTPVEIQLVKNYDDSIELIKGKNNKRYVNGNPYSASTEWVTNYPHEDPYASDLPTKKNDLTVRNTIYFRQGSRATANGTRERVPVTDADTRGTSTRERTPAQQKRNYNNRAYGYYNDDTTIMAYDPAVTNGFICGFSSLMGGTPAVIKNGKSWSKSYADKTYSFYNQNGYTYMDVQGGFITNIPTDYNKNTYIDAPTGYFNISGNKMIGSLSCIVYLNRNDILQLYEVHRHYDGNTGSVYYNTTSNVNLTITAASPKSYAELLAENYGYNSASEFDYNLRISNFLNKEKKISEWVDGAIKAFNLEVIQDGNNVTINKKRKTYGNTLALVDIDGKASPRDAVTSRIDYPQSMQMKWTINTDEWGFEESVPQEYINLENWADYGDYGSEKINMSNSTFSTDNDEVTVPFSYTWYSNFDINSGGTLTIPVISDHEWMIDGYDYEESAKHDGYGLAQRFWYRNKQATPYTITLSSYPAETVNIYAPEREYLNVALSYKLSERSLLRNYFNTKALISSNYVEIEVYLTSEEYQLLKSGANVVFDKDIYYIVKIENFDPAQNNPTKLTLMKSSSAPIGEYEEVVIEPIYRWVNIPIAQDYVCSGTSKYYKQKKQVSIDNGVNWSDVVPAEYQTGALYEENSVDCGYVPEPANYLTLHSITNNTYTFSKAVEYSVDDGVTWRSLAANEGTAIVAAGLNALFRGNISATSAAGVGTFTSTGTFSVSGNPMSLASGSSLSNATMVDYQFMRLFNGCTGLTSAEDLELPATACTKYCYQGMFGGCTSLVTPPSLPATTLDTWCYQNMFLNCTSLTTAPTLPATTLADQCYGGMFAHCTSLSTAPELPATTLASTCYRQMFEGCTFSTAPALPATALSDYCYMAMFLDCSNLTTAPDLSARTLANYSYMQMFQGCTSLNKVKCLATDISASDSTTNWMFNVASTGTFTKYPSMTSWTTGVSGIPSGWDVQDR